MSGIENSTICVDKAGKVGIVSSIFAGVVDFYYFDAEGNTGECSKVPLENLAKAHQGQIPAARLAQLAPEQWVDLGYAAAPVAMPYSKRFEQVQ